MVSVEMSSMVTFPLSKETTHWSFQSHSPFKAGSAFFFPIVSAVAQTAVSIRSRARVAAIRIVLFAIFVNIKIPR